MNTSPPTHPSYLALDRASLGAIPHDLQAHLDACAECRRHLESLREPAAPQGLVELRTRIAAQARSWPWPWLWLAGPLAAAAVALLFIGMRPQPDLPERPLYVGEKGFASVWIYVKHGGGTALWDGKKPVFAGDRLRLKVDPAHFKRVEVYSVKDPSAPELMYSGNVRPGHSATLPDAWEVDGEPGDERLLVVFSSEPVKPVWTDWLQGKAPPGVMLLPFVLPKSNQRDPSPGTASP